jgi:hypothetical protein
MKTNVDFSHLSSQKPSIKQHLFIEATNSICIACLNGYYHFLMERNHFIKICFVGIYGAIPDA